MKDASAIQYPVKPDSLNAVSLGTDSTATDSIVADTLTHPAMVMAPKADMLHPQQISDLSSRQAGSWLLLALLILLVAIGLKFRNSTSYISLLIHEITNTRRRNNMFDDTVRESSFLFLLNIVTLLSGGLLLYLYLTQGKPAHLQGALISIGITLAYGLFMWVSYRLCGWVFTDKATMQIWVRGHNAAQGLLSLITLPLALAAAADWQLTPILAFTALAAFCIAKFIFILKSARIFITGFSSIVLFFYYLCSLELVPMILAYSCISALI